MENATGNQKQLSGDWTIAGVVTQLHALTGQHYSEEPPDNTLLVDCTNIECMDMTGMQLLYTWLQCVKIKGITPYIINLSEDLRATVSTLGYQSLLACHIKSDESLTALPADGELAGLSVAAGSSYGS